MKLHGAEIVDTFAEAFGMWGARVVITAATPEWALEAGSSMTGFATSVIGCKCEASIERELDAGETPPGRLLRVGADYDESIEPTLEKLFEDRYSVQFASYPVREPWLLEPAHTVAAEPR